MTGPDDTLRSSHSDLTTLIIFHSSCVFEDPIQVSDIRAVNISDSNMTLTWKSNNNESHASFTYKIYVAGGSDSINETVNETQAVIRGLSSSTLYNITVLPFLGQTAGIPGFLQVYTCKFSPCCVVCFAFLLLWQPLTKENWWKKLFMSARTSGWQAVLSLRVVRAGAEAEAREERGLLATFLPRAQLFSLSSPGPPAQIQYACLGLGMPTSVIIQGFFSQTWP